MHILAFVPLLTVATIILIPTAWRLRRQWQLRAFARAVADHRFADAEHTALRLLSGAARTRSVARTGSR